MKVQERRHNSAFAFAVTLLAAGSALSSIRQSQADELDERRKKLETMSAEDKDALLRKKERFDRLSAAEQQRMRTLHAAIESHHDGDRLKAVLARYNEWLKSLPTAERTRLLGLPAQERIKQIKVHQQQQVRKTYGLLAENQTPPGDLGQLFLWANAYVRRHEREILAGLPQQYREQFQRADPRRRQRMLLSAAIGLMGRRRPGQRMPLPTAEEMEQLKHALSPQAKRILENESDAARRIMLVQRWLQVAMLARLVPPIENDELQRFFDEDLNDTEREKLDQLSPDQRQRQLRRLYFMRNRTGRGGVEPRARE
jgi:hypothetical protein